MTQADKRRAVEEFLKLPIAEGMTQREIADVCNTTNQYVSQFIKRMHAPESYNLIKGHSHDNNEMTDVERKIAAVYEADPSLPYRRVAQLAGVSPESVERYRQWAGSDAVTQKAHGRPRRRRPAIAPPRRSGRGSPGRPGRRIPAC